LPDAFSIKLFVPVNFVTPPFPASLWYHEILTPLMTVPEASMNKDNCPVLRENEIRLARQSPVMQLVSETFSEQKLSDKNFRTCVLAPDSLHIKASGFFIMNVCHF